MHNLFFVYFVKLYMFQAYLDPSYVYNNWYLLFFLDDCLLSWLDSIVYKQLYLLMVSLDTPETCRGWQNILRISCASSWFFLTQLYQDVGSTKHKALKYVFIFIMLQFKIAQKTKFMYITSLVRVKNTINSAPNLEYWDMKGKHNTDIKKQNLHTALVQGC